MGGEEGKGRKEREGQKKRSCVRRGGKQRG